MSYKAIDCSAWRVIEGETTKDEKLNTLFHEYLGKIRLICERWERHIMRAAENFDLHHQHDSEEQTAVEMYKEYFDHFWGRSGRS